MTDIPGLISPVVHLAARLYKRARFCSRMNLLLTCLIISLSGCLCISVLNQWKGVFLHPFLFYSLMFIMCLPTGFILSFSYNPDKRTLLIKADQYGNLKERLSTAYELIDNTRNPFYENLLQDAAVSAGHINPKCVLPLSFSKKPYIIISLTILVAVFSIINLNIDVSFLFPLSYNTKEMGQLLEEQTMIFRREISEETYPGLSEFTGDLELLSMEMQLKQLRTDELNTMLDKLGLKVKEDMNTLLAELENKEFSQEDLALLSLLAYFSSDTHEVEGFQQALESLSAASGNRGDNNETDVKEMNSEMSSSRDTDTLFNEDSNNGELESYPEYLNTLQSLLDEQQEKRENEDSLISPADNRRPEQDSTRGQDSNKETRVSSGDTGEWDKETGPGERNTSESHTGNQYENRDGEAGSGSPSEYEKGSFTRDEENREHDTLFIQGIKENGKIVELIKQLAGDEQDENAGPVSETLVREYRKEIEETVTEGKIPYEYADMVKDYFLYIGLMTPKDIEDE